MTYFISDLHGVYDMYERLLNTLPLKDSDTLYVLGDCNDRGPDGVKIWLDIMKRPNVILLKGNHESIALHNFMPLVYPDIVKPLLDEATIKEHLEHWLTKNGGTPTYNAFLELPPETQKKLFDYLVVLPLYAEVEAGGKHYFLCHTVPPYRRGLDLKKCSEHDLTWGEADYDKVYFPDIYLVTGHTPTDIIEMNETQLGIIWQKNNHIAIDCSLGDGNGCLGCYCADNGARFYIE